MFFQVRIMIVLFLLINGAQAEEEKKKKDGEKKEEVKDHIEEEADGVLLQETTNFSGSATARGLQAGTCPSPGSYDTTSGATPVCSSCIGGSVQRRRATSCTECNTGLYDDGAIDDCKTCTGGSTRRRRSTMCSECTTAGMYDDGTSDDCKGCTGGSVRRRSVSVPSPASNLAISCTDCANGWYDDATQDDCKICIAGSVQRRRATSCTECVTGKYDDGDNDDCKTCTGGSIRRRRDPVSCVEHCTSGEYNDGTSDPCMTCSGGSTRRRRSTMCTECTVEGMYDDANQDDCKECIGGSVRRRTISSTSYQARHCIDCPYGSFDDGNNDECKTCYGGSVRRRLATGKAVSCTDCPLGYFDDKTTEPGYMNEPEPATGPLPLTWNHLGNQDDCTACIGGSTRRRRSDECTECTVAGMYDDGINDDCQTCIGGSTRRRTTRRRRDDIMTSYTDNGQYGSTSCTECAVGTYDDGNNDDCKNCVGEVRRRRFATSCTTCPAGKVDGSHDNCEPTCAIYACPTGYVMKNAASTNYVQSNCCQAYCSKPTTDTTGYDLAACASTILQAGWNPVCGNCSAGYTGSVSHTICGSPGAAWSVSGCQATCATFSCPAGYSMTNQASTTVTQKNCCEVQETVEPEPDTPDVKATTAGCLRQYDMVLPSLAIFSLAVLV